MRKLIWFASSSKQTRMPGSMAEHGANNSAEGNYLDLHSNLVSALWNKGPGSVSNCGYYMSQQTSHPSDSFPLSSAIGTGGYGQLLQHAATGAQ